MERGNREDLIKVFVQQVFCPIPADNAANEARKKPDANSDKATQPSAGQSQNSRAQGLHNKFHIIYLYSLLLQSNLFYHIAVS